MSGGKGNHDGVRVVTYCVIPRELAGKLHEPLRRFFADDSAVEVIVERRAAGNRRRAGERRRLTAAAEVSDRRVIRNQCGRRIADQRAAHVEVKAPPLPRRAARHIDQLVFVERLEPTSEHAEDIDSARLVTRIQAGDRQLFADLYTRYFDRVYNYLKVVFRSAEEAEDLTQQVFLEVLEALGRYERRDKPFRAWLFVIVRNHAVGRLKKLHRLDSMDPVEVDRRRDGEYVPSAELSVLGWITDRELLLFVERLPLPQRQVLALRYMLGLSSEETATVLGRSPETVRQQQSRALRFLRGRLSAVGRSPEHRRNRAGSRLLVPQARVLRARRFTLTTSGSTG